MALHIVRGYIEHEECDAAINILDTDIVYPYKEHNLDYEDSNWYYYVHDDLDFEMPKIIIYTGTPDFECQEYLDKTEQLKNYYKKVLQKAQNEGANSVAIPLIISSYSERMVLYNAIQAISEYMNENDIEVYLYTGDAKLKTHYTKLRKDIITYCKSHYDPSQNPFRCMSIARPEPPYEEIQAELRKHHDNFVVTLLKYIGEKGLKDVECYKKANVSRQTWYKIMNEKNYKPSHRTAIAFAIALKLNLQETENLLKKAGYALSDGECFDIIIKYCIEHEIYDIDKVNEILFDFGYDCLD